MWTTTRLLIPRCSPKRTATSCSEKMGSRSHQAGEKRPELALEQIPPLNNADSAAHVGPAGAQKAQMDSGPPHLLDPGHLDDPAHVG